MLLSDGNGMDRGPGENEAPYFPGFIGSLIMARNNDAFMRCSGY